MKTRKFCPDCGRPLYCSDIPEYAFQCFACDEDFYRLEVLNTRQIEQVRLIRKDERDWMKKYFPRMFRSLSKPYPRPQLTKHQKVNNNGKTFKKRQH